MYIKYSTGLLNEIITITTGFYMQSQWERATFMTENIQDGAAELTRADIGNAQRLIFQFIIGSFHISDDSISTIMFPATWLCIQPYLFPSVFLDHTHTQFWVLTCHRCCELALYMDTFSKLGKSCLQFQESCLQFQEAAASLPGAGQVEQTGSFSFF